MKSRLSPFEPNQIQSKSEIRNFILFVYFFLSLDLFRIFVLHVALPVRNVPWMGWCRSGVAFYGRRNHGSDPHNARRSWAQSFIWSLRYVAPQIGQGSITQFCWRQQRRSLQILRAQANVLKLFTWFGLRMVLLRKSFLFLLTYQCL